MDRAERWARAKRETHGLKDWRRGVATAFAAGVCSVAALVLFGPEDAELSEALVIGGSIVGAYVLRPLAELAWNYLWGPWRTLNEVVMDLGRKKTNGEKADPEAAGKRFRAVSIRLEILRRLEGELRATEKKIVKAQADGRSLGIDGRHPFWEGVNERGFGGLQDMQAFYAQFRDCMDDLDAVELSWVTSVGPLNDTDRERLEKALPIVEKALSMLQGEIDRLVAIK